MAWRRSTWALAMLSVLLVACGGQASNISPSSTVMPPAGLAADFKDFTIVAYQGESVLGGREVSFSQVFAQRKPVVMNFWAGLCPPCRAEMPWFQKVADEFEGRAIFVGIDIGPFIGLGSHDDARQLLRELQIRYPTAYAVDASPARAYEVRSMPTTVLFDAHGRMVEKHDGILLEQQLRDRLRKLAG